MDSYLDVVARALGWMGLGLAAVGGLALFVMGVVDLRLAERDRRNLREIRRAVQEYERRG